MSRQAATDAREQAWQELALRADSMLSYIRHRLMPRDRWEAHGPMSEAHADMVIGALRSAYETDDPEAALALLRRTYP